MPKRARSSSSLTGGTGDVNPQWLNLFSTNNPGTSYTEGGFPIPIQRLPDSGKAQVMEILKVEWGLGAQVNVMAVTAAAWFSAYLTTRSFGTTEPTGALQNGTVISKWNINYYFGSGVGVTALLETPKINDLTDGAGHGILVATDNIYLGYIASAAAEPIAGTFTCRVLFRWKNVSLAEYIGIVQSQQ